MIKIIFSHFISNNIYKIYYMDTIDIDDLTSIECYITSQKNNKSNKDKYGEVFTPPVLINEILDNLPEYLWKNAEFKWLDPCAGIGNFFLFVYNRLMVGLSDIIPDDNQRKHHILKNMLYMNDVNQHNVTTMKSIFGENNSNITCIDFLNVEKWDERLTKIDKFTSFNVILLNPPYQISKKEIYKGGRGNNHTLWDQFIDKSIKLLDSKNGWLGAITPANWRRPNHQLYENITSKLIYLHIYGKKDGLRLFDAQTRFDVYIIKNNSKDIKESVIIDEKGKLHKNIKPNKWYFLPNYSYDKVKLFFHLNKTKDGMLKTKKRVIYDSSEYNSKNLFKHRTAKAKYPIVHTMTRRGLGIRWSSTKKRHFGQPKVLLNFNEKLYPYNDWKGEYGMSQLTFGIPINSKKQGDELISKFNSDDFKEVIKATKWGSFQTDYKMFTYLR